MQPRQFHFLCHSLRVTALCVNTTSSARVNGESAGVGVVRVGAVVMGKLGKQCPEVFEAAVQQHSNKPLAEPESGRSTAPLRALPGFVRARRDGAPPQAAMRNAELHAVLNDVDVEQLSAASRA